MLLLVLALALQQPEVVASVNRTEAQVGDEVVLSVRAEGPGSEPVEIDEPVLEGLEVRSVSQSSTFMATAVGGSRITTWEFRLRAVAPGRARIGPVRVWVGATETEAPVLTVTVAAADAGTEVALERRIADIVRRVPGPSGGEDVVVTIVPSAQTIVLGEQLDVVVLAWFPRDIRSRLRTRPTLSPPELQGAWTYAQTPSLRAVESREVGGRLFDLFLYRQIAFPLTAGPLRVGPATITYSLPLRTSILSREVPQKVQSTGLAIDVLPLPRAGRPASFSGVAARRLEFDVTVDSQALSVGDAVMVTATVTGVGNVSLWPEPEFHWPSGLRVYPGRAVVQVDTRDGLIAGGKRFSYLVVADSAGVYHLPPSSYAYFDLDARRYVDVRAAGPIELTARASRQVPATRVEPPRLMPVRGAPPIEGVKANMPLWFWLVLAGIPPAVALVVRARPRLPRRRGRAKTVEASPTLDRLDAELRVALGRLVPDRAIRESEGLADALRAAGVEASLAAHVGRVRERMQRAVYGPEGATDPDELLAEVQEVLRALPGAAPRNRRVSVVSTTTVVWCTLMVTSAWGQAPPPERLFEARAFAQAADSFAMRAAAAPGDPANWFNLGSALIGLGEEVRAHAALIRAARIAPRDGAIREALAMASGDAESGGLLWIAPVTAAEALVVAACAWLAGWMMIVARARLRRSLPLLVLAGLATAYAGYVDHLYRTPVALTVHPATVLRAAPFGSASEAYTLYRGSAALVADSWGDWLLLVRGGRPGWVLTEAVERL